MEGVLCPSLTQTVPHRPERVPHRPERDPAVAVPVERRAVAVEVILEPQDGLQVVRPRPARHEGGHAGKGAQNLGAGGRGRCVCVWGGGGANVRAGVV